MNNSELTESVLYSIDLFVQENLHEYSSPNFKNIIFNNIFDLLIITLGGDDKLDIQNITENIYENIIYYFKTIGIPRSYDSSQIVEDHNTEKIDKILEYLISLDFPEQKSIGWHLQRHEMLTASSIWKALGTAAAQNSLIYSKCLPINPNKCLRVNIGSPLHHGQKYEPVSILFYENLYNTKIKEFGCIPHKKYSFIGASPDGINVKKDNKRYGRMLEIKNIVNRKITGIPKKEYWIQMQLQMEVCDLPECDFLETRFMEYDNKEAFMEDGGFDCKKIKGVILCFHSREGPIYKYSPFLCTEDECTIWMDKCLEDNKTMTWIQNTYWALEEHSCILVPRNAKWFEHSLPTFEKTWMTIKHDRENGYAHRKSKSKPKTIVYKIKTEVLASSALPPIQNSET